MNKLFFYLFLFISVSCFSQQYDNVYIEKSKIDKNNIIYSVGKTFTYDVKIIIDNEVHYIDKSDTDSLTFADENAIREIQLRIEKSKLFGRTNKNQTEIKYNDYPNPTFRISTGLVENEKNIWFHPPRFGFLRALETCPFPYIKLNEQTGYKWKDEMLISEYWADKRWGIWKEKLLLKYDYVIIGEETVETKFGTLKATKIYATATSEIGKSSLTLYFNEKYGFVKFEYILFNGIKINLDLKDYKNVI